MARLLRIVVAIAILLAMSFAPSRAYAAKPIKVPVGEYYSNRDGVGLVVVKVGKAKRVPRRNPNPFGAAKPGTRASVVDVRWTYGGRESASPACRPEFGPGADFARTYLAPDGTFSAQVDVGKPRPALAIKGRLTAAGKLTGRILDKRCGYSFTGDPLRQPDTFRTGNWTGALNNGATFTFTVRWSYGRWSLEDGRSSVFELPCRSSENPNLVEASALTGLGSPFFYFPDDGTVSVKNVPQNSPPILGSPPTTSNDDYTLTGRFVSADRFEGAIRGTIYYGGGAVGGPPSTQPCPVSFTVAAAFAG